MLILCREGLGWVRLQNGPTRTVGPREAPLLAPHQAHAYRASADDPWTIQWSHFEGDEVPAWWRLLKLPPEGAILRLCAGIPEQLDLGRVLECLGYGLPSRLQAAALLPSHFSARFRERFGFAPMDYFLRLKIQRTARLLDAMDWPVPRVGEDVGFADPLHFSRRFRSIMGVSPRSY